MTVKPLLPKATAIGVTAFWAAMMGALVQREIVPVWVQSAPVSYGSLLSPNEVFRNSSLGVYFRGVRLGEADIFLKRRAGRGLDLVSRVTLSLAKMNMPLLGPIDDVRVALTARVGPQQRLESFRVVLREPVFATMSGQVVGDQLHLTTEFEDGSQSLMALPFDPGHILSNALCPFVGMRNLRVGKQWEFASLNPLTRRLTPVKVTVTAKETVTFAGQPQEVFVLTAKHGAIEVTSWVTENGEVLKQETPFGFSLLREETPE